MNATQEYLLFPAAHIGSMELLSSLHSMDFTHVLGVYRRSFVREHTPPGTYLVDCFRSPQKLIEKIETWRRQQNATFSAVIGIDDEDQFEFSAQIAQTYGLEFYGEATLQRASNKWLMKRAFVEHGVPTAPYTLISYGGDPMIQRVGFPSVLKMLSGSGSEFIMLNQDQADLEGNLAYLQAVARDKGDNWFRRVTAGGLILDPRRQFLLEKYLAGEEYSCDFIYDGRASIIRVVKKFPAQDIGYFQGFYLLNERSLARCGINQKRLEDICTRIAAALGITRGVCMVDFMLTPDGLQVIEASVRPGLSTFVPLMDQVYGYTSLGLLAQLRQHRPVSCPIPEQEGMVIHILAPTSGKIIHFDTTRLEKLPDVIGVHRYAAPGSMVINTRTDHWGRLLGYVLIQDPNFDRICDHFSSVAEAVELRMKSLPNPFTGLEEICVEGRQRLAVLG